MNSQLEKLKIELEQAVNNPNTNMDQLTKISCSIDEEIEKSYIAKREDIKNKYKQFIDRKDKAEILKQIKEDLLKKYSNISIIELEMLSSNIYDFCCLMVHHISKAEICDYISYKNTCYYDRLSNEDAEKFISADIKTLEKLTEKYIKILKSNKQS